MMKNFLFICMLLLGLSTSALAQESIVVTGVVTDTNKEPMIGVNVSISNIPGLGAIDDNLEVLNRGSGNGSDWGRRASEDLIRSRIRIKSMSFMRGRTFLNKFVIIDEAQNLTPKQMKTLITRAGPGTKIVCLGNIAQIDTPYLTEGSSGLTYVVDRFKGWPHSGHITMQRGERSRLADFASDAL